MEKNSPSDDTSNRIWFAAGNILTVIILFFCEHVYGGRLLSNGYFSSFYQNKYFEALNANKIIVNIHIQVQCMLHSDMTEIRFIIVLELYSENMP